METYIANKKDFSFSGLIILLAGIALFYAQTYAPGAQSALRMALLFFGTVITLWGLIKLLLGKRYLIYRETGSRITRYELFFDPRETGRMQTLLKEKQFDTLSKLKPVNGSMAGVKLELLVSDDRKFAAAQIFEFAAFRYEPLGEQQIFSQSDAGQLADNIPVQK